MSASMPPPNPATPLSARHPADPMLAASRPTGVSVAVFLMAGAGSVWLATAIATIFAIPRYRWHIQNLKHDPDVGTATTLAMASVIGVMVVAAAIAVLLAVFDASGRTAARILTFVYAGLVAVVAILILVTQPFVAVPWHHWMSTGVAVLTLGFVAASTVLLVMPSATGYFRASRTARLAVHAAHDS